MLEPRSEFRRPSNSLQPGRCRGEEIDCTTTVHGVVVDRSSFESEPPKKELSWKSAPRGIATGEGGEEAAAERFGQRNFAMSSLRPRFCALSPAHVRKIRKFFYLNFILPPILLLYDNLISEKVK